MTRPIRILRIIARLNVGGPAIHVALLSEKFGAPDYETTLICGNVAPTEGDMSYFAAAHGVTPRILPELGREVNPLADLKTVWVLYRLMRELKPDIVHTHTAKAGFTGRLAAWLARVPVIVHTFHGHVLRGYFSPTKSRVFQWLERLTAWMSDKIITLTESLKNELADDFKIAPPDKFAVLSLGFDLTPFATIPRKSGTFRAQWQIPSDAPLIGIVGRFVPIKNHALFLEAAAKIRAQHPNAIFALIGDGETRPQIEAQIDALGIRDAIRFTGWQRDLAPIYSDLDVLVISSDNEATPVSVIEALTAECPVVTTAVGGLPDLLEHGKLGALVPPRDADALANAVNQTLATPPPSARQIMQQRFSIDRLAAELDTLYRDLLATKRRS